MTKQQRQSPPKEVKEAAVAPPAEKEAASGATKSDLGLSERRRFIRPLPAPEVTESDGDTDWALFQELSEDPSDAHPDTPSPER